MPDKEGSDDEKKSTKSVVNKKQKQMMGEEGYDVARDMGRVKPSKDKKDATTMPPSKEMEKTRKVNKGPSALDIVKKKYKGQIMDVKKEELDLTQVAKAFGGYIVESKINERPGIDDGFEDDETPKTTSKPKKVTPKKKSQGPKITGDVIKTTVKPADVQGKMDSRNPKMGGGPSSADLSDEPGSKPTQYTPTKTIGKMKVSFDPKIKAEYERTKTKQVKKVVTPPASDKSFISSDSKAGKERSIKMVGKPTGDMDAEKYKVKLPEKPKRSYYKATKKSRKATPKELEKTRAQVAAADAKEKKTLERSKTGRGFVPAKRPERLPKDVFKRTKLLVGRTARKTQTQVKKIPKAVVSGGKETLKFARKKPFSAAIVASTVVDALRGAPKIPKPPTPKGGKVGRRTAG